jgi:hypothetical protein
VPGVGPHVWLHMVSRTTRPTAAGSAVGGAAVAGLVGTGVGRLGEVVGPDGEAGSGEGDEEGAQPAATTIAIRTGASRAMRAPGD